MDTQSLQAFVEVAERGSFSIAAAQLHLTQPAVSKRIASLEQELDCRLFDRIGRSVTLTESGRALLPRAQRILLDLRDAERSLQDLRGGVAGTLSMGISHHLGLHRLPPVLAQFSRDYPDVRLDIAFLDSEEVSSLVQQGRLELGVITLAPSQSTLAQIPVWRDELRVAVAPQHPLAPAQPTTRARPVDVATLSRHRAILPGLNTFTGQIISQLFRQQQLPLDIAMSTHYLETIKMMTAIGLGWSVLPRTLIDDSLCELRLAGQSLSRDLGCVHHPERSLSNAARAFLDTLRAAADRPAGRSPGRRP